MRLLGGKPLIQYTLEAARDCALIDDIFISSDDREVVELASELGIGVPYDRPAAISGDTVSMFETVQDGLNWLQSKDGGLPDVIALLQPTSPLRNATHLEEAIEFFFKSSANTLVSVHQMKDHPFECIKGQSGSWQYLAKPNGVSYRQAYPDDYYYINGAIYLMRTPWLIENERFCEDGAAYLYEMDAQNGVDIDSEIDFMYAEFLQKMIK
jgi:CMP-N-acetylneuraminic acid synthetase